MSYFLDKIVSAIVNALVDLSQKIINFFLLPIGLEPNVFTSLFPYAEYYIPVIRSLAYIIMLLIAIRQYQKIVAGQNYNLEEIDSPFVLTARVALAFVLITFSVGIFSTIVTKAAEPIRNVTVTTAQGDEISAFMINKEDGKQRAWTSITDAFDVVFEIEMSDGTENQFLAEYGVKYFKNVKVDGKDIQREAQVKKAADEDEYWKDHGGYEGWREMALEEYEQTKEIMESSGFSSKSKKDKCMMRISVNLIRILTLIPTTFMMVKLLLSLLHRYVLLMSMVLLSPLACASFPSKSTAQTFNKCIELFISTILLFYLESMMVRICLESYVNLTSSGMKFASLENWHMLFISFTFIAMVHVILNLETYISSMLAVAPVSGQLAGDMARDARGALGLGRSAVRTTKGAISGAKKIKKGADKIRKKGEDKLEQRRKKKKDEQDRTKIPPVNGNEPRGPENEKTNGKTPRGNDRKVNESYANGKDLESKLDGIETKKQDKDAKAKILKNDGKKFEKGLRKLDRDQLHETAARLKKDGKLPKEMENILDGELSRRALNQTSGLSNLEAKNVSVDGSGNLKMDLIPNKKAGELSGVRSPVHFEQTTSKEGTALNGSYVRVTSDDNNVSANNFMAEQWGVQSHKTTGIPQNVASEQFKRSGFDYNEISKTFGLSGKETLGMYQDQQSGKLVFHTNDRDLGSYEVCRLRETKGVRQDLNPIHNRYKKSPSTLVRSE